MNERIFSMNAKVINILFYAFDKNDFNRVSTYDTIMIYDMHASHMCFASQLHN